jgi:hypothetical protein
MREDIARSITGDFETTAMLLAAARLNQRVREKYALWLGANTSTLPTAIAAVTISV